MDGWMHFFLWSINCKVAWRRGREGLRACRGLVPADTLWRATGGDEVQRRGQRRQRSVRCDVMLCAVKYEPCRKRLAATYGGFHARLPPQARPPRVPHCAQILVRSRPQKSATLGEEGHQLSRWFISPSFIRNLLSSLCMYCALQDSESDLAAGIHRGAVQIWRMFV